MAVKIPNLKNERKFLRPSFRGKINALKKSITRLFSFVAYNVYVLCLICMGGRKRKKSFSSIKFSNDPYYRKGINSGGILIIEPVVTDFNFISEEGKEKKDFLK